MNLIKQAVKEYLNENDYRLLYRLITIMNDSYRVGVVDKDSVNIKGISASIGEKPRRCKKALNTFITAGLMARLGTGDKVCYVINPYIFEGTHYNGFLNEFFSLTKWA